MTTIRAGSHLLVGIGLLALSAGLSMEAYAQNPPPQVPPPPAIVSGVFVDEAGIPIRHAVLSVVGESLRVVTDSQGRFRLMVRPGPRLLAVRALGYRPLMWTVALESGREVSVRVRLQQLSVVLPEMTVVGEHYVPSRLAGFYQRKRIGFGKYIDPETIALQFTNSTADVLRMIPGVRVRQAPNDPFKSVVSFPRCEMLSMQLVTTGNACLLNPSCANTSPATASPSAHSTVGVYVDGFRIAGDPGETLAMINPADVEAIEVYRGPAELPAEFMSDDCAAIVIWTKY